MLVDLGLSGVARSLELEDGSIAVQFLFSADSDLNLGPQEGRVYGHAAVSALARGLIELLREHVEKDAAPAQQVD